MVKNRTPKATGRARSLRSAMTDGEKRLWRELRQFKARYNVHVRRQVPIGPYIADFAVLKHHLIIEVDGQHHFTSQGRLRDARRDAWLAGRGYRILRINTGGLADNFDGCVEAVMAELGLMS